MTDSNAQGSRHMRVLAWVTLLTTAEGERRDPAFGSYRPDHNFGDADNITMYMGQITIPPEAPLWPGDSREVIIDMIDHYVAPILDRLSEDGTWRLQEGRRHVGHARLIKVLSVGDYTPYDAA